jgi:hypothetical protein
VQVARPTALERDQNAVTRKVCKDASPFGRYGINWEPGSHFYGGRVSSSRVPRVYAETVRSQLYVEIYMREQA